MDKDWQWNPEIEKYIFVGNRTKASLIEMDKESEADYLKHLQHIKLLAEKIALLESLKEFSEIIIENFLTEYYCPIQCA